MKRSIVSLLFIIFTTTLFSQAPNWQWAAQAGGLYEQNGFAITTDAAMNSYITGSFEETVTFGSYSLTSSGASDVFVAMLDSDGNWQWATQAGGGAYQWGTAITIDDVGNSYVMGCFMGTAIFGNYSLTSIDNLDIFVAMLNSEGNWQWATQAGGSSNDWGNGIVIDNSGNIYVTGNFEETITFDSYSLTSSGDFDVFVAMLDSEGNWQWATQAGGSSNDWGNGIIIDNSGNSYVTGDFGDIATFGSNSLTSSGDLDVFVAMLDSEGIWQWATQAGGNSSDSGNGITIDNSGNSYVTGYFVGIATFGSNSLTSSGGSDVFVAMLDSEGIWQWATQAGGNSSDRGNGITIDNSGNSYVTGYFGDIATFGSYTLTNGSVESIYLAKMGANGTWQWATQESGNDYNRGFDISIDDTGNCYVTGFFYGTAIFGLYTVTSSDEKDIFVAKLGNDTSVENEISPIKMELSNYPNPFNPETTMQFNIKGNETGILTISNIKGQVIESHQFGPGQYNYLWDASKQSSGIYFYKLSVNDKTEAVKKCLLLK
jgi:hypothetical protein